MLKIINTTDISDFEKGPIRRSLFSNGATCLFHKSKGMSGAKVNLYFLAGSVFEKKSEYGLSHVIEHMIFKENEQNLTRALELHGAEINAYTYKEYVCFEMSCLGRSVDKLLKDFLALFMSLDFTKSQFDKEKSVIVQELKEDMDDHETYALEHLFKKNFGDDLGHSIGGTPSMVRGYKEEDVRRFYQKYYTPERMILTITASGKESQCLKIFEKALIENYIYKEKRPFRLKALDRKGKLKHFKGKIKRKVESSTLFLAFNGVTLSSRSYYDYAVLDEILFEGLSSLFFKKLRIDKPLVYGLGSSLNSFKDTGSYVMQFNCQKKNIQEVRSGVFEVLNDLVSDNYDFSDLDYIKRRIINNTLIAFDSIEQRADFISDNEIYELDEIDIASIEKKVAKVTSTTIKKLVKKILEEKSSELVVEPISKTKKKE